MKFKLIQNSTQWISTALCIGLAIISIGASGFIHKNQELVKTKEEQESAYRNSERDKALTIVAKEYLVDKCVTDPGTTHFVIGHPIRPMKIGKIPYSCAMTPDAKQYGYIAEENGNLQLLYVFSQKELTNKLSTLNK
jgi:hypothetical protein